MINKLHIKKIGVVNVSEIVDIHKKSFPESNSTKYGDRFLIGYYKGVCKSKNTIGYVCLDKKKVVGFVIGGINKQALSRQILYHSKFDILISACYNLFKNPKKYIKNYWLYLRNYILPRKDKFYSDKTAVLDSIAVLENYRGKNIAERLVISFLDELRKKNIEACRLGVESSNMRARKFYEKMGFLKKNKEGSIYIFNFTGNDC